MDPKLWELLRKGKDNEEVEAIIRLDHPQNEVSGLRIVSRFGPIATCRLKTKEIIRTREAENVLSLKAAVRLAPEKEPDDSYGQFDFPRNTSQNRLRRPKELSQTGAGVVIGIVDFGCDFNHPDLKNEDGSTRLLALWDQGGNGITSIGNKFGYGTIFTRQHIDWALRQPNPYRALGYQPGIAAHGTHVTSIAAGNGLGGGPAGVAPEADIVFVHMASKGTGGLSNLGNSVRLLEAIDFVTEIAQNRPWVINLSVGLHGGPHDGCTPVEMALDHLLLGGPNRFIVQSTGNYFNKDIHASGRLREGEVRALRIIIDETDQTPNELEIWYAAGDEFIVKTESPNGTKSKSVRLGKSSKVLENGRIVGMLYNRKNDPNNSDHLINLFLDPIASSGEWIVHIKALRASNGVYHAWLERDDCPGCQPRFAAKQSNKFYTTGTLANGHIPLVVGAYNAYSRKREAPPFSSVGPTRDNRQKPDLVGPGVHELAARSDANPHKWNSELYTRKSGTSMAAPHVTGTVALCLEASSRPLSCHEIRKLILGNTENVSNNVKYPIRYGHGYLDIAKAIRSTLALSTPSKVQKEFPTTSLKEVVYPEKTNIMKEKINEAIAEIDNLLVLSTLEGSKIDLLAEIMQPSERSRSTISTDPDELYGNIVYKRNGQISKTIAKNFEVLALPGESLEAPPQRGDLLLRVALGEPGLGHVAMISESTLTSDEELSEFALASESQQPGFYSTIIEGGSFPHTLRDFFARRILDHNGEMPAGQVLLRPRLFNVKENYEESFDYSSKNELFFKNENGDSKQDEFEEEYYDTLQDEFTDDDSETGYDDIDNEFLDEEIEFEKEVNITPLSVKINCQTTNFSRISYKNALKYALKKLRPKAKSRRYPPGFGAPWVTNNFNKTYWIVENDPQKRRNKAGYLVSPWKLLELKPGKSAYDALIDLTKDSHKWTYECASYIQAAHLYALARSSGCTKTNSWFKTRKLWLRYHRSIGLKARYRFRKESRIDPWMRLLDNGKRKRSKLDDATLLAKTSIGSRVMWHNLRGEGAWKNENTVKVGPNRYRAFPLFNYQEAKGEQIALGLASYGYENDNPNVNRKDLENRIFNNPQDPYLTDLKIYRSANVFLREVTFLGPKF